MKRMLAVLCISLCAGCAQSHSAVNVTAPPQAELFESVTRTVYPQDQSVFGSVYDPEGEPRDLVPAMPGETPPEQRQPPLMTTD
ncbi:hypothetical protein SAMN02799624_01523 [Paenibacillus sp. UNC496MF]|uniref:hypothetical protein n=1 Tax=Paenibacillus sp. UNC496MF TaxID=1502753 RepID=UPI0008E9A584|nr:hypothetical protein [Paenibacillus sp. UNC496MF]SFI58976.1 hypothetical protein SAMN02799624_01523 [Paenibacillus sp. UNC496MF]